MAIKSVYGELFEQLPIPERLEPENIAKMLEEKALSDKKRSAITVSSSENKNTKSTRSATYRAIMSVAACLVLAFGVAQYMGYGEVDSLPSENSGANAAENYDELHKTFTKYYVDNSDKRTLDSAMAEIEHSYNEAEKNDETDEVEEKPLDTVVSEDVIPTPPVTDETPSEAPEENEGIVVLPDEEEDENDITVVEDEVALPDTSLFGSRDNVEAFGNRFFINEDGAIRIIYADGADLSCGSLVAPEIKENEEKTLIDYFVYGDVLVCAYDVKAIEPLDASSEPASEEGDKTALDEILDGMFTEEVSGIERRYVEVTSYTMIGADAFKNSQTVLAGTFVDIKHVDSSVYVITNYNDYRLDPISGVSDLESYVPSYTVDGIKTYLNPQNILIPEYVSTTDYTVIAGFDLTANSAPAVKALLGYEGRILVTDNAVYVFGYENIDDVDYTTIQKFDLSSGSVSFGGSILCEGIAIGKDGITEISGAIVVSTLKSTETGLITSVCVYDSLLNPISKCEIPDALTEAVKDGCVLMLSGSEACYNLDLANPAAPVVVDHCVESDLASGLARYNEGFVTLTDVEGNLVLSLVSLDENLKFKAEAEKIVYTGEYTSKALEDNSLLYIDDVNGLIGVPYGYFDGYDFLYRYDLFKVGAEGIELVGKIETHEMDPSFEFSKAMSNNGYLYIFSQGRVYSALATSDAISAVGSCAIIESTYSGHVEW